MRSGATRNSARRSARYITRLGWSGMPSLSAAVFLRRNSTRLLPSVYSRTRVSSHPRYSASIDSRVEALIRGQVRRQSQRYPLVFV